MGLLTAVKPPALRVRYNSFYTLDQTAFAQLNQEAILKASPETNIEYLKLCCKPRPYSGPLNDLFKTMPEVYKKKWITFQMCLFKKRDNPSYKIPKAVLYAHIFPTVHTYAVAQRCKPMFLEDIARCKAYTDSESGLNDRWSKEMFHFLYNDFATWFEKELKNI